MKLKDILNAPNRVSLSRILLIPVFMAILLSNLPNKEWLAFSIFMIMALTDSLDGYLARTKNQITALGKYLDPLADKMIISAALITLVELGQLSSWIAVIIISREFAVSGLRMVTGAKNIVIQASYMGKIKTLLQVIAIAFWIVKLHDQTTVFNITSWIVMSAAIILTVVSGIDYFIKAKDYL
ncbi:MAG: CDP-diacylglycerol--glycerol-3-phosphate 3-phosphatidyltransferase [Actinobacteria bacterium]|nr:MAG: CDP-diacylglycerol--glycerol-3-phosphate 3-phosphatidyltransferase [Actinomycetota bacterium]